MSHEEEKQAALAGVSLLGGHAALIKEILETVEQIAAWFDAQAAKERDLLDSDLCTSPVTTQERWLVYKASAMAVRAGEWRKKP